MREMLLAIALLPTAGFADVQTDLGAVLFFSPELSVTGTQSCSSCHDPATSFASGDAAVNSGGGVVEGAVPGRFGNRKPPSIAYGGLAPVFHHELREVEILGELQMQVTFVGGNFNDGRAKGDVTGTALGDQAMAPFVNPQEMAMPDEACVVLRACALAGGLDDKPTCDAIIAASIDEQCRDPAATIKLDTPTRAAADKGIFQIARAIAAFERSPAVTKFTSRFDDWQAGRGTLTDQERAGFDLFIGPAKCGECHVVTPNAEGGPALFTDFTYSNIGLPKNPENPWYGQSANVDGAEWRDKGLGEVLKDDPAYRKYATGASGTFKVPTLRGVDARTGIDGTRAYGHNGYFKTIEGFVHFYNTRDKLPRCAEAMVTEADALAQGCWPAPEVPASINTLQVGSLGLTAQNEADLVAFLKTLTDR